MSRFTLSAAAANDLSAIIEHTRRYWSDEQARAYLDALEMRLERLGQTPLIGRERPDLPGDLLSFPVESHIAYYRIASSGIAVIRILHRRQDPVRHIG